MNSAGNGTISALFLVGATATGKTAVAQHIAESRGYSILSADSMLIYRGMNIGTAKPTLSERSRVNYYGLDLVDPDETFNVWQYRKYALSVLSRDTTFMVVGGSGLYIKSLTHGITDAGEASPAARAVFEALFQEKGIKGLQQALLEKSPSVYEKLKDRENPRRLIRALEMAEAGDEYPSGWEQEESTDRMPVIVGLRMSQDDLHKRIKLRVEKMYRDGLIDEVKGLISGDGKISQTGLQAIGYAEAIDFIEGKCSESEAVERTVIRTRQLAKKQGTWFKRQENIDWVDVQEGMPIEEIASEVEEKWQLNGFTEII